MKSATGFGSLDVRPAAALALLATVASLSAAGGAQGLVAAVARAVPLNAPVGTEAGNAAALRAERAGVDLGSVVERVRHHVAPAQGRSRTLVAEDRLYRAEFNDDGFALTLRERQGTGSVASRPFARTPTFSISIGAARVGRHAIGLSPRVWSGNENRAERGLATGLSERVTAREGSVEWDVVLARALGGGDLRVDARVRGAGSPERLASYWRFPVTGGRAVRVGSLVVKDTRGRELYRALPHARQGGISLVVPAAVLAGAAYPVTIDPTVSPEYAPAEPLYEPRPGDQSSPAVAWNGAVYLVVWQDPRPGTGLDVYGTRVTASGAVIEHAGIPISTASGDQTAPALAWNGTDFVLAWEDRRSGPSADVYGARVSGTGAVLEPGGIPISTAAGAQLAPSVAAAGSTALVTWEDARAGQNDVYGARLNGAGTVLDPGGIGVSTTASAESAPAVASDGTDFLVAWQQAGANLDVYAARVRRSDGAVLDPSGIAVSAGPGDQVTPAAVFNGTNYGLVWSDTRSGPADVFGARVSPTGSVLDASGFPVSTAANAQERPAIGWNGTNFFVVWEDLRSGTARDVYAARVTTAGAVLEPAGLAIAAGPGNKLGPTLASEGGNVLVSWTAPPPLQGSSGTDVVVFRLSATGGFLQVGATTVTRVVQVEHDPAVAWNGAVFLVAWQEASSAWTAIYAARVTAGGAILDGHGIEVSTPAEDLARPQQEPAVAAAGSDFLVVWRDRSVGTSFDVYGGRVSGTGVVLDPFSFAISTAAGDEGPPSVASNGTSYLVSWLRAGGAGTAGVYRTRVSTSGAVLDPSPGLAVSTSGSAFDNPAVTSNGSDFLVAWSVKPSGGSDNDAYAARVSGAGTLLDPGGIVVSGAAGNQTSVAAGSNTSGFLVAWKDARSGSDNDVFAARLDAGGTALDPSGIAITPSSSVDAARPAVAWNGSNYLVVWDDARSGPQRNVYGGRVSSVGTLLDPTGLGVAISPDNETAAAVAGGPSGFAAVPYVRTASGPVYGGADRIFFRIVKEDDAPPPPSLCSRSGTTLSVAIPAGAAVTIRRAGTNFSVTGGGNTDPSCGGSTVSNVDTVAVSGAGGSESLTLDLSAGPFAPGATAEGTGVSEIEFTVDLGAGVDSIVYKGSSAVDQITLGTGGVNLNTDSDADVTGGGAETTTVNAGAGNDKLSAAGGAGTGNAFPAGVTLNGEDGNETLTGGAGSDTINGGNGNDTFKESKNPDGADSLTGGAGTDTANYGARTAAVTVRLDGVANDGGSGGAEGDNVSADVEKVTGGKGADTIDAATPAVANTFTGGNGADTILGGPGNDTLKGGNDGDTINGGPGNDKLYGDAGNDSLNSQDGVGGNDSNDGGTHTTGDTCTFDAGPPADSVVNCEA